ncbi:hypothetical protein C4D60_Mb03t21240 [Musa balbisiana]|uniref:Uncharacterized protein n=1 Tax=Musa balbisiana TaxID=52838 RepID=A0A4S8JBF1_MUSBA|nr:hypothetical protein C4D60_Mb03t21240 [Musa balbisiana]
MGFSCRVFFFSEIIILLPSAIAFRRASTRAWPHLRPAGRPPPPALRLVTSLVGHRRGRLRPSRKEGGVEHDRRARKEGSPVCLHTIGVLAIIGEGGGREVRRGRWRRWVRQRGSRPVGSAEVTVAVVSPLILCEGCGTRQGLVGQAVMCG